MSNFEDYYRRIAESSSVDSRGKAVFYSGKGNHARALAYARRTGAVPLDNTPAGKKLNGIYRESFKHFGNKSKANKFADAVMIKASKRYAENARGHVNTFVMGAKANRVFRTTELPALVKNQKVKSINGVNRRIFEKAYAKDPNRAFRLICLSELRRDKREGIPAGDKKLSPHESHPSKKQGAKEKMASLRNQERDRHQNRDKALKKSGDQKQTRPNNSREHLKSRYGKPTEGQRGNIKPLKDRAKISSNQSDRASAKNKPSNPSAESRPSKKQGTGEKISAIRSQSRAKYQERNQSLKKSREQKAKPPTATRDNTKARYGKSSEANRTKELSASNRELKKSGNSMTSRQDSKSKSRGDSKPNRGGGGSRGKESRRR